MFVLHRGQVTFRSAQLRSLFPDFSKQTHHTGVLIARQSRYKFDVVFVVFLPGSQVNDRKVSSAQDKKDLMWRTCLPNVLTDIPQSPL